MRFFLLLMMLFVTNNIISQVFYPQELNWTKTYSTDIVYLYKMTPLKCYLAYFTNFDGVRFHPEFISKNRIKICYIIRKAADTTCELLSNNEIVKYKPTTFLNDTIYEIMFYENGKVKAVGHNLFAVHIYDEDKQISFGGHTFNVRQNGILISESTNSSSFFISKSDIDSAIKTCYSIYDTINLDSLVYFNGFYVNSSELIEKRYLSKKIYIYFEPQDMNDGYLHDSKSIFSFWNEQNQPIEYIVYKSNNIFNDKVIEQTFVEYDKKGRIIKVTETSSEFDFSDISLSINNRSLLLNILRVDYVKNKRNVYFNDRIIYETISKKTHNIEVNYYKRQKDEKDVSVIFYNDKEKNLPVKTLFFEYNSADNNHMIYYDTLVYNYY
ncbi:MAG: hypothetical protein JXL97_13805 [Bacteroidales bacterium]|nr:hypothetical protein [Bacteroidales bacterium]